MKMNRPRGRKVEPVPRIPRIASVAVRIKSVLRSLADPEKARGGQSYFKEPVLLYGVSSAESRGLALEIYGQVKAFWGWREATALADRLLPDPHLEVKAVAIILLGRFVKEAPASLFGKAKSWLLADYCNNWASVDTLCPEVLSPLLARFPALLGQVESWTSARNRWLVRASAVSLIFLARRGKELERAYAVARRLFCSEDDLIQKATGWLLREAGKTDMKRLEVFLLAHGPKIPRTTLRYAIERFEPSARRRLLAGTR